MYIGIDPAVSDYTPESWSTRPASQGLTLESLKAARQKVTICVLCERLLGTGKVKHLTGTDWLAHARCPQL